MKLPNKIVEILNRQNGTIMSCDIAAAGVSRTMLGRYVSAKRGQSHGRCDFIGGNEDWLMKGVVQIGEGKIFGGYEFVKREAGMMEFLGELQNEVG